MSDFNRLKHLLEQALERSEGDHTIEDVRACLESCDAQFWPADKSAAVTEIVSSLNVWLYGGALDELPQMDASASAWAKKIGLNNIALWGGRKGWRRELKKLGYKEQVIMVKDL